MVPKDPQVRSVRDDSGERSPEVSGSVRAKHLESGNQQVGWLARRQCTAKLDQPCSKFNCIVQISDESSQKPCAFAYCSVFGFAVIADTYNARTKRIYTQICAAMGSSREHFLN